MGQRLKVQHQFSTAWTNPVAATNFLDLEDDWLNVVIDFNNNNNNQFCRWVKDSKFHSATQFQFIFSDKATGFVNTISEVQKPRLKSLAGFRNANSVNSD
jgi:hypothetical protein